MVACHSQNSENRLIHYHGTRIAASDDQTSRILRGRHACVSFADLSQLSIVQEVCQSWMLDNGAYSFWNSGKSVDWEDYYKFVSELKDPTCDFWIIPDQIDGFEDENNRLISECPIAGGAPVWHFNESLEKLQWLTEDFERVCIGTTAGLEPDSESYWIRLNQALDVVTDDEGRVSCKLHGLRALKPQIFTKVPFASADSTSVGRNIGESSKSIFRNESTFDTLSLHARAMVLIDRIESFNSPRVWKRGPVQQELF